VPAAAVRQMVQALSGCIGRIGYVGGILYGRAKWRGVPMLRYLLSIEYTCVDFMLGYMAHGTVECNYMCWTVNW